MTIMILFVKILILFFVFVFLFGGPFLPPRLALPKHIDTISDIEPYLQKAVDTRAPPSIVLTVVDKDATLYSKSFGYTDSKQTKEASDQTVYQWWSLTKLFTAIAILQLEEKGLLSIDDPVSKHLPLFKVSNLADQTKPITIRQLLSHSSGLGDIGMPILGWIHFENDPYISQTELLQQKFPAYSKLATQPGEEGNYSNLGYVVLAGVIESVTGKSYESYIIENILEPLKMYHTNFTYTQKMLPLEAAGSHPKDFLSRIVPVYLNTKKAFKEKSDGIIWFNRVYSDQKGSTGLIGSAQDITKFMRAILNKGELDGVRILSASNIEKMQTSIIPVSSSPAGNSKNLDFGLAWFIDHSTGELTLTHGGAGMAFVTLLRLYPERNLGVVVFTNSTYLGRSMGLDIINLVGSIRW
jgi:D-alanyl-D-alanine carboxypeptidase